MSSFSGERSMVNRTTPSTAASTSRLIAVTAARTNDGAGRTARASVWLIYARSKTRFRCPGGGAEIMLCNSFYGIYMMNRTIATTLFRGNEDHCASSACRAVISAR